MGVLIRDSTQQAAATFRNRTGRTFDAASDGIVLEYRREAGQLVAESALLWRAVRGLRRWGWIGWLGGFLLIGVLDDRGAVGAVADLGPWLLVAALTGGVGWLVLAGMFDTRVARRAVELANSRRGRACRCVRCGYDLTGTPGDRCSECGQAVRFTLPGGAATTPPVGADLSKHLRQHARQRANSDRGLHGRAMAVFFATFLPAVTVGGTAASLAGVAAELWVLPATGVAAAVGLPVAWLDARRGRDRLAARLLSRRTLTLCWDCGGDVPRDAMTCRHCDAPAAGERPAGK